MNPVTQPITNDTVTTLAAVDSSIDADTREVLKTSFSPQVGVILETVPAEASAE